MQKGKYKLFPEEAWSINQINIKKPLNKPVFVNMVIDIIMK